jgi:uncharacterized paraquat-inducible protein A
MHLIFILFVLAVLAIKAVVGIAAALLVGGSVAESLRDQAKADEKSRAIRSMKAVRIANIPMVRLRCPRCQFQFSVTTDEANKMRASGEASCPKCGARGRA